MNLVVSQNLDQITPDSLPPFERQGPVRMLFVSSVELGFRRYYERLIHYSARDPQITAVHVELRTPLWMWVLGKSIPVVGSRDRDLHSYRHMRMWRGVLRRWLLGPLDVRRFDVVHLMTQGIAMGFLDVKQKSNAKFALNLDSTSVMNSRQLHSSAIAAIPWIAAERKMFARADLLVCRNAWCADSLRDDFGIENQRICIARNSIRVERCRTDHPPTPPGTLPKIVFVGNDYQRKGAVEVLRMHQEKWADRAELHICSAKMPPDYSCRNVHWHGAVPNDKLRTDVLPNMDLFVMPTRYDMHPWAILEAAAAGLPVVTTRLAGIPEMVKDQETGFLCGVKDWPAVSAAIEKLLADPDLRIRMGQEARRHITAHYDPDAQFGGLMTRLKRLADDPSPAATHLNADERNRPDTARNV